MEFWVIIDTLASERNVKMPALQAPAMTIRHSAPQNDELNGATALAFLPAKKST